MPPFEPPLSVDEVQTVIVSTVRVKEPFATGGQAALFLADYADLLSVLKVYKEAYRVRAERECLALERVQSAQIVRLLGWGTIRLRDSNCVYTLTEFVSGTTLAQRLVSGPMTEEEVRSLGVDIALALKDLWIAGRIVHRDLKPQNIIVRPDGRAVILDLGIARHTNLETYTEWGVWLGTAGYMSPEQARARKSLTFKSDFFALGVVLYEALAGLHPFQKDQTLIGQVQPKPLRRVIGATEAFSTLIDKLLSVDPLDRPRSFDILIAALRGE